MGADEIRKQFAKTQPDSFSSDIVYTCVADIQTQPIKWLWKPRFAYGKVSLIVGDPGGGKSQLTIYMAAIVSIGGVWVDKTVCEQGNVLILSAEDDRADTIRPRLEAVGADLNHVFIIEAIRNNQEQRPFNLKNDLNHLYILLQQKKDIRLIIIDPISAYLGETDSHNNAEVRSLLTQLADLATKHGVAIVCVSHLNKNVNRKTIMRITGSLAFVAAARAAFLVVADQNDNNKRLFLMIKNNIGDDKTGLAFVIKPYQLSNNIETSRVEWTDDVVSMTADQAMSLQISNNEEQSVLEDAKDFLLEMLANGQISAQQIYREAKNAGHTLATIRRAKKELKITANKSGFSEGWFWTLPSKVLKSSEAAHEKTVSTFEDNEHLQKNTSENINTVTKCILKESSTV